MIVINGGLLKYETGRSIIHYNSKNCVLKLCIEIVAEDQIQL